MPADAPAFWPLEADLSELQQYVTSRVRPLNPDDSLDDIPVEPAWFREGFEASWLIVLAQADTW